MARIFQSRNSIKKVSQRHRETKHEQYLLEHKGVTKCPECGNVHFKKRWYASVDDLKEHLKEGEISIAETKICRACDMVKNHLFEGELLLDEVPTRHRRELLQLIERFGKAATKTDPQDRIISAKETDTGYRVCTTENQLADKIAKKIKDAFPDTEIAFSRSPKPDDVTRIHITFHTT